MEPLYLITPPSHRASLVAVDYDNKFEEYLVLGSQIKIPLLDKGRIACFAEYKDLFLYVCLKEINFVL